MPRPVPTSRITVVAPHPDDEVFGVGGLMSALVARGHALRVVAVTDGEAAFGPATASARAALVERRSRERHEALVALGVDEQVEVVRLGLPDGAVAEHEQVLADHLVELSGPVLLATWRHDGHPDHEATGRAAAMAARSGAVRLVEYPVWAGHRGRLADGLPAGARRFRLTATARAAKACAVSAFRSQLAPSPDGRPVVPAELVDQLVTDDELVFM